MRAAAVIALTACGGAPPPPSPTAQVALEATRAGPDDVVVATVDGKPVWGSCVAAQAARQKLDRAAALRACVDFELLAQTAAKRGLDQTPEVASAATTALVSRFVEVGFENVYKTASDLGVQYDKYVDDNQWRMHRPEFRASAYVRVAVPAGSPPDVDARAHAVADRLATKLADERGMFKRDLVDAAIHIAGDEKLEIEPATGTLPTKLQLIYDERTPEHISRLDAVYGAALFAIPEVGRITAPVHTKWGWDVILWTGGITPREITREALADELFADFRRAYFNGWVGQIIRDRRLAIERHVEILEAVDAAEKAEGSAK